MKSIKHLWGAVAGLAMGLLLSTPCSATAILGIQNGDFTCNSHDNSLCNTAPTHWTLGEIKHDKYGCCFGGGFTMGNGSASTCNVVLSQSFSDLKGPSTLCFCFGKGADASLGGNQFEVKFDNVIVFNDVNFTSAGFIHESIAVTAKGSDNVFFFGHQANGSFDPTHIQINAGQGAPEVDPGAAAVPLALTTGAFFILADRRKRQQA